MPTVIINLMRMRFLFLFVFVAVQFSLLGQNPNLAQHYYQNGEYEKAATIYDELLQKTPLNDYYLNRYIECLMAVDEFGQAEDAIKKAIKKQRDKSKTAFMHVTYGKILERRGDLEAAKKKFSKAISILPANRFEIQRLANSFIGLAKYDYAQQSYEKGITLLKDESVFATNLGDLYRRKGQYDKMIYYYLESLKGEPIRLRSLQSLFQRYLPADKYVDLQEQLFEILQEEDAQVEFQELLAWTFVLEKDFASAFRQIKAIDLRLKENGKRVFDLANLARGEKNYAAAIEGYEYIVNVKGDDSPYFFDAKQLSLACKTNQLTEGYRYTESELLALEQEYETFLTEVGHNRNTAKMLIELANIEAFYLKNIEKAKKILGEVIELPGTNRRSVAEAKLALGDMYLIEGDVWESTLLYSQVDKEFKEDELGQKARYQNAQLSYFNGDFEWAQTQFSVLKNATSRPIANNAIDMSVFIMDNLGLDTTPEPLRLYSQAELLIFQNKFDEAFKKLDSLNKDYPGHALDDDLLFLIGKTHFQLQEYDKAAEYYQTVVEQYPEEIRADNALFALADMNENIFSNKDKAKELYEKLFLEYSSSTLAVEARKHFRRLRGDSI